MSPTSPADRPQLLESLQALTAEYRREHEQVSRELAEVGLLIKQTATEIERLTPQRQEALRRQREMETALEHYSRADIRKTYTQAQEAQLRLFLMQSRLEQLEYKQRTLERTQQTLGRFLELVRELPESNSDRPAESPNAQRLSPGQGPGAWLQAQEDDRLQVARLLHDQIAQTLAGLVLRVQICERLLTTDAARCEDELRAMRDTLAGHLHDVRRLGFEVRPLILDDLGVVPTLRRYVQTLAERDDRPTPPIDLVVTGAERRLVQAAEVNLFRIAQEALSNACQHAIARRIRLLIDFGERSLRLVVEDDGSGVDVGDILQAARERRAPGVATMLDRAALLGGPLLIESTPGQGTRVTIQVPLDDKTLLR